MTMLLSDYCFEINTHGIKKRKKAKQYWPNGGGPAFAQDGFLRGLR